MSAPMMSVILLTCNRLGVTKKTLEYLIATTHVDYELVIVHNHNQTKEAQILQDYIKTLKLSSSDGSLKKVVKVLNKKNRGVAGGRNDGIFRSSGTHKVYVDDDVLLPDCWAEEMLSIVEVVPEVATVGVSVEKENFRVTKREGVQFQMKAGNIGGAITMIPYRTFKRFGYLCEDYGIYGFEDADLYLRIKALNKWNVYIYPMKAQHIDPENDKAYRKFKDNVYNKDKSIMEAFNNNKKLYVRGKGLYIPYAPKI